MREAWAASPVRCSGIKAAPIALPLPGFSGNTSRALFQTQTHLYRLVGSFANPVGDGAELQGQGGPIPGPRPYTRFRTPGMSDSSGVQPPTPERGLRQGRYRHRVPGPIALDLRGGASLSAPDRRSSHAFCQMRDAEGLFLSPGLANGGGEMGGSGMPGRGSSAPSRGAASWWGDREASAGSWAASGV